MTLSREAIEAVRKAVRDTLWENPALTFVGQSFGEREADRTKAVNQITDAAITASLPFLRPAPSQSDEERAHDLIRAVRTQNWKNGGALSMDIDEAESLALADYAAVRAEATLAERKRDGTWERLSRETAECLKQAVADNAAKDAEIARLRGDLEYTKTWIRASVAHQQKDSIVARINRALSGSPAPDPASAEATRAKCEAADEALIARLDRECYPLARQMSMVGTKDLRALIAEYRLVRELLRRAVLNGNGEEK